ncbi:MAG: phenylacetate--CoA ligase family protein [Planctomycetaceae bacterium]|nr:phenylacetate--CoA ligase family protein [Planctomycetales bacterium]MCB9921188.1 phenylacetate--CoA ligase family protein [Planctomycetaceae bacterium]
MLDIKYEQRRQLESLDESELARLQLDKLNALLATILPRNTFYASKLSGVTPPLDSLADLDHLPFTFKDELIGNGSDGDFANNLTYPIEQYSRFHRTSGTRGHALVVLDTDDDWRWWVDTWQFVLDAAELTPRDRVFMAFSFGPFIGFWSAFDAAVARGCLVIPGGGLSTMARLDTIRSNAVTTICCTPTYALHMVEVAAEHDIKLASFDVQRIIVAGEPGGSLPAVRGRIEAAWNAKVIDHGGATEIGPWGYANPQQQGLHVVESEFIAEFLSVDSGKHAGEGELAELVLTTLGRTGSPVIRYRTGDLVRPTWNASSSNRFVFLDGGILGRSDDMMIIRGVNIFPSSIEQILHSFPEVIEYRITATKDGEMDALGVEVEDRLNEPGRIAEELQLRLGLRVDVASVQIGSLPRFEGKGKRFIDRR